MEKVQNILRRIFTRPERETFAFSPSQIATANRALRASGKSAHPLQKIKSNRDSGDI